MGVGGYLETTPAGMGGAAVIPGRNGDRSRARGDFFEKPNCWRRPERWKPQGGKRTREAPAAEQGGRHKGGGLAAAASAHARGDTARGPARPKSRTGGYE